ncbi:MAG: hypothetical protein JWL71_3215, partial [Acidobacteria bacterium]|nr:hypothetical protein [Acidobacteriota bacterium]
MRLVADRFAVDEDGRAFDLVTGGQVTLIVGTAGGVSEQLRWTVRCTSIRGLRHRAKAPLVDFGMVGEASRFEAWYGGPGLGADYPEVPDLQPKDCVLRIADCGLRMIHQPAIAALAEMFDAGRDARPRVASLIGPAGVGKRTIVAELARIARMNGFIPVAARLVTSRQAELWRGRTLFVIVDASDEGSWAAMLNAALAAAQPHVLLIVGEQERRSIGGVVVRRMPVDALVSAVWPAVSGGALERTVRRAAERADGLPGRFARLLWPDWKRDAAVGCAGSRTRLPRVAEVRAMYGVEEIGDEVFDPLPAATSWPAPGELALLRRKMAHAIEDLARGRQAPGIRELRQVVGSLARRGAWSEAARGAVALAAALLRRGRTREVQAVVADGRDYATRAGEETTLVDLAVVSGEAWIDMARLDEADSVLGGALAAARALPDAERTAAVSIAVARGSYWRGEYADAETILSAAPDTAALRARRTLLAVRIAVGLGDPSRAMSLLTTVADGGAAAACVTAFVHLAVGDLSAAERDLAETLVLARAARDPLRALRARLLRAEIERRRGRPAGALAQLQRLARVMATAPPILRARWDLARVLASPDPRAGEGVARHVA